MMSILNNSPISKMRGCQLLLVYLSMGLSTASPLFSGPSHPIPTGHGDLLQPYIAPALSATPNSHNTLERRNSDSLTDCLASKIADFGSTNTVNSADFLACAKHPTKRDLEGDAAAPGSTDSVVVTSVTNVPPLIVDGAEVAAKPSGANLLARDGPSLGPAPPKPLDLAILDQQSDGDEKPILDVFLETAKFDNDWSLSVCRNATQGIPKGAAATTGQFNYNIQGSNLKNSNLGMYHDKEYLHLYLAFTPLDAVALAQYDMIDVCRKTIHQAVQSYHEQRWGAFGINTVYSVTNRHYLQIQQRAPLDNQVKRGSGGNGNGGNNGNSGLSGNSNVIALVHIELGDKAKDLSLFNNNGLPLAA